MAQTVEVEIDAQGEIHLVDPETRLAPGRALLVWPDPAQENYLLSEASLAKDWLRPEEDEAWAYLQPEK